MRLERGGAVLAATALAFGLTSCATPGGRSRCVVDAAPPAATPLMWRAQPAPGGASSGAGSLYLFGSVHVGERQPELSEEIERAFAVADELVVEVELGDESATQLATLTAERALLEPPTRLADVLSEETYQAFAKHLADRNLPLADFEVYEPWYLATVLVVAEFAALGFQPQYGVDQHFSGLAEGHKPVRGLETVTEQVEVLDGLSLDVQDRLLADALESGETFQEATLALLDAWQRGDEAGLAQLIFKPAEEEPGFGEFYEAMFYRRNEKMSERLAELIDDGQIRFVVLGAGHMVGPQGIPSQLCEQGLAVERISGGG